MGRTAPKHCQEGKRNAHDPDAYNDELDPQLPVYHSGNNFTKDPVQTCLPPTITPHCNVEATGSIFCGDPHSDFVRKPDQKRTMMVHDWCLKRNKHRDDCDLVSIVGVARSEA